MASGQIASFTADWGFLLDPLSSVMILVVTGIGFLIHVYSTGYMAHDNGYYRFFGYLNLFVFFMLMLVLANNYILLFVGWEGVGLCSYLLIGFYFHKKSAGDAGKKAFVVNRVGDAGFILGMLLMLSVLGTVRFTDVNALLRAGCQIYEREDGILHSKTVVADGVWSIVGSSNFDHRSVLFNDEIDAVVIGSRTGGELQNYFDEGVSHAHRIEAQSWNERAFSERMRERFWRLWETLL